MKEKNGCLHGWKIWIKPCVHVIRNKEIVKLCKKNSEIGKGRTNRGISEKGESS